MSCERVRDGADIVADEKIDIPLSQETFQDQQAIAPMLHVDHP